MLRRRLAQVQNVCRKRFNPICLGTEHECRNQVPSNAGSFGATWKVTKKHKASRRRRSFPGGTNVDMGSPNGIQAALSLFEKDGGPF
jgi:hypothetical protein